MNTTDYRYQLETRRVTHRRQQKFTCPDLLWFATAGCGGLSSEKLETLHNRRLLLRTDHE